MRHLEIPEKIEINTLMDGQKYTFSPTIEQDRHKG